MKITSPVVSWFPCWTPCEVTRKIFNSHVVLPYTFLHLVTIEVEAQVYYAEHLGM